MKKTLLVAAMMASFTGAAVAQNSVTLYGRLAPAMLYQNFEVSDKAKAFIGLKNVGNSFSQFGNVDGFAPGASLYGLRGVEDLGNGLKVSFQFEEALSTNDARVPGTGNRVAALTVSNASWGRIGFGRDNSAANTILGGIDALGTAYGVGHANNSLQVTSIRLSNQIKYMSPTISGFTFGLSYSFSGTTTRSINNVASAETFGTSTQNRLVTTGIRYANGPMVLAGLYTQVNPANANFGKKVKNWTIGGTYDLKVVKVHGAYGQNIDGLIATTRNSDIAAGNFGTYGSGAVIGSGRTNQWAAGLSAPLGAGKLAFNVGQIKPGGDFKTVNTNTQTNTGIAYTYAFSKRTNVFASYSYMKNLGMVDGITANQVGAGITHSF